MLTRWCPVGLGKGVLLTSFAGACADAFADALAYSMIGFVVFVVIFSLCTITAGAVSEGARPKEEADRERLR